MTYSCDDYVKTQWLNKSFELQPTQGQLNLTYTCSIGPDNAVLQTVLMDLVSTDPDTRVGL